MAAAALNEVVVLEDILAKLADPPTAVEIEDVLFRVVEAPLRVWMCGRDQIC